jgi:dolichyl-phosphate-mannose--protein O-mannosyl transferase
VGGEIMKSSICLLAIQLYGGHLPPPYWYYRLLFCYMLLGKSADMLFFKILAMINLIIDEWNDFYFATKLCVVGWFMNYFPFYIMGRVM